MTLAIRRATPDDLAAIRALGHEVNLLHVAARPDVFAPAGDPRQYDRRWRRDLEEGDRAVFVAERAGTAIGFVTAHVADEPSSYFLPVRLCQVGSLGVAAAERGRGVGRALMAALEAWAVERNAGEVHLTVWQFNARARRLYAELGYEERTTLMCKRLARHNGGNPARATTRPAMTTPPNGNLYDALRAHFPERLDDVAIETADGPPDAAFAPLRYTWADLERGSARMAALFADLGLAPGARVLVHADKSVEAVMLYLAVLRAGLVHVPLNTAYQASEVEHFIDDAEPALIVCAPRNFAWVSRLAFARGTRWVLTLGDDRTGSLLERAAQMGDGFATRARAAGDLAAIIYTSGTTGRSKGARLSHGNLRANAETLHDFWQWRDGGASGERAGRDVLIHALPIFHVHGLFVALHGALRAGARMLWFHRFDPLATIARLPEASVFMGVPTLYVRMLAQPALTREACRAMRLFVSGSAPLLADTFDAWRERTGHTILERYGMSETVMLASNPYRPESARRGGTVGRALPGVGVRVHDDQGRPCATGDIGHIEVRGPSVFAGYWRLPEKTREDFTADGWFRTGDVGALDADGVLTLVGRSKDLIISGGFNVYPAEVEGRINELAGVAESAVVGVPHADFGEAVVALVVARAGAALEPAAIAAALKATIAGFKVPKHVRVVDALPRNAMGKVQKKLLREELAGLFAAEAS